MEFSFLLFFLVTSMKMWDENALQLQTDTIRNKPIRKDEEIRYKVIQSEK